MTSPEDNSPRTLIDFFADRLEHNGDDAAVRHKSDGQWNSLSWGEFGQRVTRRALGLQSLGVNPGDRVAQVAENSLDWLISDTAILVAQAVHVPIHPTLSGRQIIEQIGDCGAGVVLFSTSRQFEKVRDLLGDLKLRLVSYESEDECAGSESQITPISALEASANPPIARETTLLTEAREILLHDSLATILYTSGTTGEPKGVMLTHGNLVSNVVASLDVLGQRPGDVRLGWLPLSHVFARTCDWYTTLGCGGVELCLAESRETILEDCTAVSPTVLNGVPYFFEKVARGVEEKGAPPSVLPHVLGGRIRQCMSGGAALPEHVARFFHSGGVRLAQGYGLTETSPVITINPDVAKPASVGPAVSGVEIGIGEDGEILTRGPHVMRGYWGKPGATAEVLRDGWLATGDLGRLDEEGYLFITGRKKELIVTAAGKNVAPVFVESLLTADPLIAQAMVIGDGRKYLTALLVVDQTVATELELMPNGDDKANDKLQAVLRERIAERLARAGAHEQVKHFRVIARPFSIESGELTPTLKLRREIVARDYAKEIEEMYE